MLPTLSARWSLNDTQADYLFTVQFVASMMGMVRHSGYRLTLVQGLILMAVGIAALALANCLGMTDLGITRLFTTRG